MRLEVIVGGHGRGLQLLVGYLVSVVFEAWWIWPVLGCSDAGGKEVLVEFDGVVRHVVTSLRSWGLLSDCLIWSSNVFWMCVRYFLRCW